jgi:hypothetical protein
MESWFLFPNNKLLIVPGPTTSVKATGNATSFPIYSFFLSGCDGGFAAPAMQWIMDNNGIALQQDYKYLMVDGWCDPAVRTSGVTVKGYVNVTMNSEAALQQAGM